jgi:hypothetical protein
MSRVGFEPTTPVSQWTKTVHALDLAANWKEYEKFSYIWVFSVKSAVGNESQEACPPTGHIGSGSLGFPLP